MKIDRWGYETTSEKCWCCDECRDSCRVLSKSVGRTVNTYLESIDKINYKKVGDNK